MVVAATDPPWLAWAAMLSKAGIVLAHYGTQHPGDLGTRECEEELGKMAKECWERGSDPGKGLD